MYHHFFELTSLPFENTADPRFFYASEQHLEAMAAIEYTIRMHKGIVLVTGDIGTGKTTIGRAICKRFEQEATILLLTHGLRERSDVVGQLCRQLDLPTATGDEHSLRIERIQRHLLERRDEQRSLVVMVDEAQTLSDEALEELRLIANFDNEKTKLMQLVLIGQPELRQRIRDERFTALRQRIAVARQLRPMDAAETRTYIAHRLSVASVDPQQPAVGFTEEAAQEIYHHTRGVPRLINVTCDNCLLLGFVRERRVIDVAMVRQVRQDMLPSFDEPTIITTPRAAMSMAGSH